MAEVVVELGGKEILRVPLKGPTMVIGRDPQCDLHLDNRALYRRHAQVEKRGAALWVRDLGSKNGTFVNGARVAEAQVLNGGDHIELGRYQVRIDGVEEARQDTPVLTLTGPEGRHRFAMVGDEIIIGRAPSCDIAIGHKSISRRHLRIGVEGDHFVAEDLGSQNGSRINNKRINGPTAFHIGDKVQMSDFVVEVGFLEASPTQTGPSSAKHNTMMIDRSELAKAAYVGGDLEKGGREQPHISLGNGRDDDHNGTGGPEDEMEETRGLPDGAQMLLNRQPGASTGPPRGSTALPVRGVTGASVAVPDRRRSVAQGAWITVSHPDQPEREVLLQDDVTIVGEDGSDGSNVGQRSFATQAFLVLVRTSHGIVGTVAGDRRLLVVNGHSAVTALLNEGDMVELGVLTVVFHHRA